MTSSYDKLMEKHGLICGDSKQTRMICDSKMAEINATYKSLSPSAACQQYVLHNLLKIMRQRKECPYSLFFDIDYRIKTADDHIRTIESSNNRFRKLQNDYNKMMAEIRDLKKALSGFYRTHPEFIAFLEHTWGKKNDKAADPLVSPSAETVLSELDLYGGACVRAMDRACEVSLRRDRNGEVLNIANGGKDVNECILENLKNIRALFDKLIELEATDPKRRMPGMREAYRITKKIDIVCYDGNATALTKVSIGPCLTSDQKARDAFFALDQDEQFRIFLDELRMDQMVIQAAGDCLKRVT